ncbi:14 kDa proline-rich protein DC2.15-like [Canna indica]|uniref:14 kDa proline-rich protein DC2.15-like n=1 Tax=Canna indica TaxID=4628 RepID=A0AAQ3Q956_9LILI|nr:14 kDa proline-rich protein DC2.15-like [Canna indica]
MASKTSAILSLLLLLDLFFTLTSACGYCPGLTPPKPTPTPTPTPKPTPKAPAPKPSPTPSAPKPSPTPSAGGKCPVDTLKLASCSDVLNGLINIEFGKPPKKPCCGLIEGLDDGEAALCLCTALKANVLGNNLNIPVDLSLLINYCGKKVPAGFQCA